MKNLLLAATAALAIPAMAQAHFLLEYTPDTMIDAPGDVPVKLIFWHPFENGHVMDLELPEEFYMIHNGEKTDLKGTLKPVEFTGEENSGAAFKGSVPVKRSGDYVLATVPVPYYEASEDIYIQQITKAFLNRNQLPTDWAEPVGLPTEIVPLNKKYGIEELLQACADYPGASNARRITFEYIMLKDKNDSDEHAHELVRLLKQYDLQN